MFFVPRSADAAERAGGCGEALSRLDRVGARPARGGARDGRGTLGQRVMRERGGQSRSALEKMAENICLQVTVHF